MGLVRTLIDYDQDFVEPALPQELRELYDGDLHFGTSPVERPFVIANFVSTLDGVVSYEIEGQAAPQGGRVRIGCSYRLHPLCRPQYIQSGWENGLGERPTGMG